MELASLLHLAPLALTVLILIAMMKSMSTTDSLAKVAPVGRQAGLSVASFVCAVAIPAALGALRAGVSGAVTFPYPHTSSPLPLPLPPPPQSCFPKTGTVTHQVCCCYSCSLGLLYQV